MAEIKYKVCDKCGSRLDKPRTWRNWKRTTVYRMGLAYRTPDAYDYSDYSYELCDECGKALQEWLNTPPAEKGLGDTDE